MNPGRKLHTWVEALTSSPNEPRYYCADCPLQRRHRARPRLHQSAHFPAHTRVIEYSVGGIVWEPSKTVPPCEVP